MRILVLLHFLSGLAPAAFAQQTCYGDLLSAGNKHMNAARYEKAIQQYEAAKLCGDKPANGDSILKTKIAKARQQLKEDAEAVRQEKEAAAEKARLTQEEELKKRQAQDQLAEFAWQKVMAKPTPLQYFYFTQKYPYSRRSEEAKQKISAIQASFEPLACTWCPEMVFVSGGSYIPGDMDEHLRKGVLPPAVQVDDFQIGKFEVTSSSFCQFLNEEIGAPTNQWSDGNLDVEVLHPVRNRLHATFCKLVYKDGKYAPAPGWESAPATCQEMFWGSGNNNPEYFFTMYADWLSIKTGQNYRLPYLEEWDYAAKGGAKSEQFRFAGSNDVSEVADVGRLNPVGQRRPNELGLCDMSGNVSEFTLGSPDYVKYACSGDVEIKNYYGTRLVLCSGAGTCGMARQKETRK